MVARVLKILKTRTRAKAAVRPIFRAMDEDGFGGISHEEFVQCMRRWGLREPAYQLHWVAEAIDSDGTGAVKYDAFSRAMVSNDMENGMMQPELKAALQIVHGKQPPRSHNPEFPDAGAHPFPAAPSSLRGGAAALSSKYAWSEWGGVPVPSEKPKPPTNPEDEAIAAQQAKAQAAQTPAGARRVQERAEARQRHKVQTVLDTLRRQVEMHGSIAAAFRKLEVSGDSKISHEEVRACNAELQQPQPQPQPTFRSPWKRCLAPPWHALLGLCRSPCFPCLASHATQRYTTTTTITPVVSSSPPPPLPPARSSRSRSSSASTLRCPRRRPRA